MFKYIKILCYLFFITICSCQTNTTKEDIKSNSWKKSLFDTTFLDSEIKSIDFIEIEHPMLGGISNQKKLSTIEMKSFLSDIRNISFDGIRKCRDKYVIRLNFENDTLRLKACGKYVSNRFNDIYYSFPNEENIIEKLWKK